MVPRVGAEESWTWAERRLHAIGQHAAAHREAREAETRQAREQIAEFVRHATELGLAVVELHARPYSGRTKYRTGLRGWYVHHNLSLAVGPGGEYYRLLVPATLRARFLGVNVSAADPPLVVGEGGRDGESIPLRTLLRRRLEAGDNWPS
jgi:hypothetical protein